MHWILATHKWVQGRFIASLREGGGFLRSKKTEGARDEWNYRALPFSLGRFCKYLLSDVSRPMAPPPPSAEPPPGGSHWHKLPLNYIFSLHHFCSSVNLFLNHATIAWFWCTTMSADAKRTADILCVIRTITCFLR